MLAALQTDTPLAPPRTLSGIPFTEPRVAVI